MPMGWLAGGPGATFSVEAGTPAAATDRGLEIFRKALARAGLASAEVARVDTMTEDYRDHFVDEPAPEYVGLAEVAETLGVSRQRVYEIRAREDFPKPIAALASGPVWLRANLNRFIASWERRPGRPKKLPAAEEPGRTVYESTEELLAALEARQKPEVDL
jgi:predicted DNA-binding transcriptional regulator AlpA